MTQTNNTQLSETEARQGERKQGMPSVLAISTAVAGVALIGIYALYASFAG